MQEAKLSRWLIYQEAKLTRRSFRMNGHDLQASGKYEELKSSGSPEFNVFFRKVGATDMDGAIKGGWYPVGSLA